MNKNRLFRALFVVGMTAVALLLIYFAFLEMVPELIPLLKNGSEQEIETYLSESSTVKGVVCLGLLQMVQVWSIFISGVPIQVAAGIVYGIGGGFLICMSASVFAHWAALRLWRRLGRRMESWMPVGEDPQSRLAKYLGKDTPPVFMVVLACLIPIMPNGVIPIAAAKTDITEGSYLLAIFGGTAVNILICCAVGKQLILGNYLASLICVLALLGLVAALWLCRRQVLRQAGKIRDRALARRQAAAEKFRAGK